MMIVKNNSGQTPRKKGLVIVNTGNGKGKTTAALGVMLRAWGRGMKVGVVQFLKHEQARFGEIKAADQMNIDWLSTGDGFTWTSRDMDETTARARHGWELAKERIASGGYDVLILDEFTYPLHFEWLDTSDVIDWLKAKALCVDLADSQAALEHAADEELEPNPHYGVSAALKQLKNGGGV